MAPVSRSTRPKVPEGYRSRDGERQFRTYARRGDERCEFEIDRSRILHSAAFRRLSGKTQIFGIGQSDHFRTRLTHSLEVAQIAKGIALRLDGVNAELCEAAGLAHEIGHPPFGHKGENVLMELMACYGGFEANAQNFRILTQLETRSVDHPGLDLTRATLDALFKYKWPFPGQGGKFYYAEDRELATWIQDGQPGRSIECAIMDWADDIAYAVHDLEDGSHIGLITVGQVEKHRSEILATAGKKSKATNEDLDWAIQYLVRLESSPDEMTLRSSRKQMTSTLINEFIRATKVHATNGVSDSSRYQSKLVPSRKAMNRVAVLKALSFELAIDDSRVHTLEARAERILKELFEYFSNKKSTRAYPGDLRGAFAAADSDTTRARVACDFIAGMTDQFAERLHERLFGSSRVALLDY